MSTSLSSVTCRLAGGLASLALAIGCMRPAPPPSPSPPPVAQATLPPTENLVFALDQNGATWTIDRPVVSQRLNPYPSIELHRGDKVTISARGCVQVGGRGKTWRRYVDPRGPKSETLYHALIDIPGVTNGPVRLQDVIDTQLTVPPDAADDQPRYLTLGFTDDFWGDNGYYDHDVGFGCQCNDPPNAGNASVVVRIISVGTASPTPIPIVAGTPQPRSAFEVPVPRSTAPSVNVPFCRAD